MSQTLARPLTNGAALPADRLNPTRLSRAAFLLNPPFSYSTAVANNVWMQELTDDQRRPDQRRSMIQFMELYRFLAGEALVFLLPTPRNGHLQDLVFTANLGVVLEHLPDRNTVVISNFTSPPRRGETRVGRAFFQSLGYETFVSPHRFEGEADLKHLHDDIYIGGCGMRSESAAFEWMEETFGARIIKVGVRDPYLYHLDCSIFPVTRQDTVVCTSLFEKEEVAAIERVTNIIDVAEDVAYNGVCNSVRLSNCILNSSNIHELKVGTEDYAFELAKNRALEDIAHRLAFEVCYFNLSEFMKGGALLSCMAMHLNRNSYSFTLTA